MKAGAAGHVGAAAVPPVALRAPGGTAMCRKGWVGITLNRLFFCPDNGEGYTPHNQGRVLVRLLLCLRKVPVGVP